MLLTVAALGGTMARLIGYEPTVGYVIAGMLCGPSGYGGVRNTKEIQTVASFGSIFMLFSIGLEFPLDEIATAVGL